MMLSEMIMGLFDWIFGGYQPTWQQTIVAVAFLIFAGWLAFVLFWPDKKE